MTSRGLLRAPILLCPFVPPFLALPLPQILIRLIFNKSFSFHVAEKADHVLTTNRHIKSHFSYFKPASLMFLAETISQMKSTKCSLNTNPIRFLKDVFETVGPSILLIINRSLLNG